ELFSIPKKAISKQGSCTSKKDTTSTSKKVLTFLDKKNTSIVKNNRTHNDQNKINESYKLEDNFNKVFMSSNTDNSQIQYSNSQLLGSRSHSRSRYSLPRHSCSHL
ncbi:22718_t:CDS:1, partial [Racocetra persica]